MIQHFLDSKNRVVNKFNRFSKFLLIGNNIDGKVRFNAQSFNNFEEVKKELPQIIMELQFEGEWDLKLYQVPDNVTLKNKWGYYRVPSEGKLIFEFSYMEAGEKNEVFLTNNIIHFCSKNNTIDEVWDKEHHHDFSLCESYLTIVLKEDINNTVYENENYPGDLEKLHKEIYELV